MEKIETHKTEAELGPEVEAMNEEILRKPEVEEALALLDGLPENLKYHNKGHTLDVIHETILFALADGVSRAELEQQAIATAWHDVGYVVRHENNEPVAVEMFQQSEAYKPMAEEARAETIANILDTTVRMQDGQPVLGTTDSHSAYLLDADVSNFGRTDYFDKRLKVAAELGLNLTDSDAEAKFNKFALALLKNQQWQTSAARLLRQAQKEINIARLEKGEF